MQSNIDSEEETHLPSKKCQAAYDSIKFLGILIYQLSYCLMIGHMFGSNFANNDFLNIFKLFFIVRPLVIIFYTFFTAFLAIHRSKFTLEKLRVAKRIEIEKDNQAAAEKAK